jgi:hypothetical protein
MKSEPKAQERQRVRCRPEAQCGAARPFALFELPQRLIKSLALGLRKSVPECLPIGFDRRSNLRIWRRLRYTMGQTDVVEKLTHAILNLQDEQLKLAATWFNDVVQ